MYEPHHEPLLPRGLFLRRLGRHSLLALGVVGASIAIGMAGFHWLAYQTWWDSYLNTTMLLGGMGPVGDLEKASDLGKLFAGLFSLYSGVVFIGAAALVLAPLLHRALHKLHLEEERHRRVSRVAEETEANRRKGGPSS